MVAARVSPPLTIERARQALTLDEATGQLFWTAAVSMGRKTGQRAGSMASNGYRQIKIDGTNYLEHRVVWLLSHGEWPAERVDHKNGDKTDNRPAMLREATANENAQNQRPGRNHSASGLLGVTWEKGLEGRRKGRWVAQIRVNGKQHRLGRFDCKYEAHEAYLKAKRELHSHCTI